MRSPARVAAATLLAVLLAAAVLPASGAQSSTTPLGSGSATVRIVVRTTAGGAHDVTQAATTLGASRVGRVRALHALSFEVSSYRAASVRSRLAKRPDVTSVGVAHRRWFTDQPADPRYGEQRSYLAAIGAETAWDQGALGSPGVRIGIVDSGVDVGHPDLAGKVVGTYNAVTGGTDVRDVVGHGTGTASVAAAATGNGIGMAGAGRNTSILAVKVADVTGRIFTDDLAAGIVWAVDHGAAVVNLSLGGPTTDPLERAAVAYAQAHGVLVVASAGNEGTSAKQYPGALPGVVAVGATSATGSVRAPFSSYGGWVDLGAPGRSVLVATPGGGYETADGTSYSAPLVSGTAALLAAYRPGRTATELAQALVGGSDSARYGFAHGLVHVDRSLALLPPAGAPTINAPATGSVVSGGLTVTVSSAAPRVRIHLADLSSTVSVQGGTATATFETFGLSGAQTVTAVDCSSADQCSAQAASTGVTVDNGAPGLTSPAPGSEFRTDSIAAAASAPGGAVRFTLDGRQATTDLGPPYAADLSTSDLPAGSHDVRAVLCRSDGAVCDDTHPADAGVSLARLHPAITGVTPRLISPGRDGRSDATTVRYRLDSTQQPVLQVRNTAGAVVFRKGLGSRAAGPHTATWAGQRSGGGTVADGTFTVQVSTSDGALQGLTSTTVRVDRTAPALRAVRASSARVFPVHDHYLDAVNVSAQTAEDLRWLRLEVRTGSGALVRTVRTRKQASGTAGVVWNGRRADGRLVPGRYRVQLVGQDLAGNRSRSARPTVTVSAQRLVTRSGSMTVTARASLEESFADDCSEVFRRTSGPHAGWVSYAASSICTSGDGYAAADHQVRLPRAVRYGTVRLSAYGGRGDRRYRDHAKVVYYDELQNLSDTTFRLAPQVGLHRGPQVRATPLLIRSRVFRWVTMTTGVAWYDVKTYRVDFTYFVLR